MVFPKDQTQRPTFTPNANSEHLKPLSCCTYSFHIHILPIITNLFMQAFVSSSQAPCGWVNLELAKPMRPHEHGERAYTQTQTHPHPQSDYLEGFGLPDVWRPMLKLLPHPLNKETCGALYTNPGFKHALRYIILWIRPHKCQKSIVRVAQPPTVFLCKSLGDLIIHRSKVYHPSPTTTEAKWNWHLWGNDCGDWGWMIRLLFHDKFQLSKT